MSDEFGGHSFLPKNAVGGNPVLSQLCHVSRRTTVRLRNETRTVEDLHSSISLGTRKFFSVTNLERNNKIARMEK